jgi:hypothetical protein
MSLTGRGGQNGKRSDQTANLVQREPSSVYRNNGIESRLSAKWFSFSSVICSRDFLQTCKVLHIGPQNSASSGDVPCRIYIRAQ